MGVDGSYGVDRLVAGRGGGLLQGVDGRGDLARAVVRGGVVGGGVGRGGRGGVEAVVGVGGGGRVRVGEDADKAAEQQQGKDLRNR